MTSEYMLSETHYSPKEAKTFADIIGNSESLQLMDYKIGAQTQTLRRLEVTFQIDMTMDDYEKIALMMIENVKTKFGKNEQQSSPS